MELQISYVDTVGKNESRIAEYVRNQLKEDEMGEQLRIPSIEELCDKISKASNNCAVKLCRKMGATRASKKCSQK